MLATRRAKPPALGSGLVLRGPSRCAAVCRAWDRGRVCARRERYAPAVARCPRCALPAARAQTLCGHSPSAPPRFDAARAAVDYRAPWDHLVRACKFHDAPTLAPTLAGAIAGAERERGRKRPSLVLPVPFAAARPRTRGYPRTRRPAANPALLRMRETEPERALPLRARAGGDGAIFDAVLTTGSAGAEAARVPKQARAAAGEVGERARTPRPDAA